MLSSIVAWVLRRLLVGGFPAPLVPGTCYQLDVAAPSMGDSVGRIITPGGIYYDTGQASVSAPR